MLPKKEHTRERIALETAVTTAANALKVHSDINHITTSRNDRGELIVEFPRDTAQAVIDENTRLSAALRAAKAALAAYRTQHPAEFTAPIRGRGRGIRGTRGGTRGGRGA